MKPTALLLMLSMLVLASAWTIDFYSGEHCTDDAGFFDVHYSGSGNDGSKDCMVVGQAYDGIECTTNTGSDCTGPIDSQSISLWYPEGTNCWFGVDAGFCPNNVLHAHADTCTRWLDLEHSRKRDHDSKEAEASFRNETEKRIKVVREDIPTLYFRCWDH